MTTLAGHDTALVWLVACGFGVAAVALLAVLYRRVAARHELEVAERVLDEAYREDPG